MPKQRYQFPIIMESRAPKGYIQLDGGGFAYPDAERGAWLVRCQSCKNSRSIGSINMSPAEAKKAGQEYLKVHRDEENPECPDLRNGRRALGSQGAHTNNPL